MTLKRVLPVEDVEHYLRKGTNKANQVLACVKDDTARLKTVYDAVVKTTDRTLDNLSIDGYQKKDDIYGATDNSVSEPNLRALMLCAFKAVQCLEEIQPVLEADPEIDSSDLCGADRHEKLLSAVTVFRTDGKDDFPALDVEDVIKNYRHNQSQISLG